VTNGCARHHFWLTVTVSEIQSGELAIDAEPQAQLALHPPRSRNIPREGDDAIKDAQKLMRHLRQQRRWGLFSNSFQNLRCGSSLSCGLRQQASDGFLLTSSHPPLCSPDVKKADLTYSRPSVYFEAGYAQRVVPVIYTVRRDHFKFKADDPNGNLKVHFDLQMRNIIDWSSASDKRFPVRLRSRVTKVVLPILLEKGTDK
jgi:hypothetical protein